MKVFMIGGTGLLGSEAAFELIKRGHQVSTLALPPIPKGTELAPEMDIKLGNFIEMSDEEIKDCFKGCEGFVFAAGIDERVPGPPPIYETYKKFNITALERLLKIAKEVGVKHAVICGSYFSHFAKIHPKDELTKWHPYIRSRIDQEEMSISYADDNFDVAIIEIPYVFGTQKGREPVWTFLVEQIRSMEKSTLYPKGGTTMVTVKQVGQAIVGALERSKGGKCYPLGYYNMTWVEMLRIIHKYIGTPDKKITTIPNFIYALGAMKSKKSIEAEGHESGLHPVKFTKLMCSKTYIDKKLGAEPLGVEPDDIEVAIGDSIKLCIDILDGKAEAISMKAE